MRASNRLHFGLYPGVQDCKLFGGWVRDRIEGLMCIISCEYVLHVIDYPNAYVVQPARCDGGTINKKVAKNLRGYLTEYYDCAIARVLSDSELSSLSLTYRGVMAERCMIGPPPGGTEDKWYGHGGWPYVDEIVEKRGRSTQRTYGKIVDLNDKIYLDADQRWLREVMKIEGWAESGPPPQFVLVGDSGALVLQRDSHCVRGLLTARKTGYNLGWAQHWDRVAEKLELDPNYHNLRGLMPLPPE